MSSLRFLRDQVGLGIFIINKFPTYLRAYNNSESNSRKCISVLFYIFSSNLHQVFNLILVCQTNDALDIVQIQSDVASVEILDEIFKDLSTFLIFFPKRSLAGIPCDDT